MIAGRLEKAKIEFREIPTYDYLVINDKVSNAVEEIEPSWWPMSAGWTTAETF